MLRNIYNPEKFVELLYCILPEARDGISLTELCRVYGTNNNISGKLAEILISLDIIKRQDPSGMRRRGARSSKRYTLAANGVYFYNLFNQHRYEEMKTRAEELLEKLVISEDN